jgi:hypothetical protein
MEMGWYGFLNFVVVADVNVFMTSFNYQMVVTPVGARERAAETETDRTCCCCLLLKAKPVEGRTHFLC